MKAGPLKKDSMTVSLLTWISPQSSRERACATSLVVMFYSRLLLASLASPRYYHRTPSCQPFSSPAGATCKLNRGGTASFNVNIFVALLFSALSTIGRFKNIASSFQITIFISFPTWIPPQSNRQPAFVTSLVVLLRVIPRATRFFKPMSLRAGKQSPLILSPNYP